MDDIEWQPGLKLKLFFAHYNGSASGANRPAESLWYDFDIGET
jgi:hypothetical protein